MKTIEQKAKRVPAIRFAGFDDEWVEKKLDDISDVRDGTHASPLYKQEGYPFVTSKNVKDGSINYDDIQYISKEDYDEINKRSKVDVNDILMGMIGTIGNLALVRTEPSFAIKNVALIKDTQQVFFLYLYHYLQSWNIIEQLSLGMDGGTQKFIALNKIRELNICIPSNKEQQKTGLFLESVSALISLEQKKYDKLTQVKKSMLEKMFPKEGATVPEIRFAGFTGEWDEKKLCEIADRITRKNQNLESNLPLTISAQYGLIDQNEFFDKRIASKDISGYYLVKNGEFAYNKSTSAEAPWGAVKRLDRYEMGVLSTLYIVFGILENKQTDSNYLATYFNTNLWHKEVQLVAAEGARNHGLLNISADDFLQIDIMIPKNLEEQQKIGSYFSHLDSLISLQQRKLEKLKNIKKSLLEKMFV